ncbi:MAG: hypothetical protein KJO95_10870 [Gammaproteobacteria bacterium]|nr:hypothetical protein [Gammaproteobacteria bacterium]
MTNSRLAPLVALSGICVASAADDRLVTLSCQGESKITYDSVESLSPKNRTQGADAAETVQRTATERPLDDQLFLIIDPGKQQITVDGDTAAEFYKVNQNLIWRGQSGKIHYEMRLNLNTKQLEKINSVVVNPGDMTIISREKYNCIEQRSPP